MCKATESTKRVLVVDQGSYWRSFAADTLSEEGYEITVQETYDLPDSECCDLILLGCELIREPEEQFIRSARANRHKIAVAAMNAFQSSEMRRGFLSGAHDVFVKPLARYSLLKDLEEVVAFIDQSALADQPPMVELTSTDRRG